MRKANGEYEQKLMMKVANQLLMSSNSRLWAAYQKLRVCAREVALIEKNKRDKLNSIIRKGGLGKKYQGYGLMIKFWRQRKAFDQRRNKIVGNIMK